MNILKKNQFKSLKNSQKFSFALRASQFGGKWWPYFFFALKFLFSKNMIFVPPPTWNPGSATDPRAKPHRISKVFELARFTIFEKKNFFIDNWTKKNLEFEKHQKNFWKSLYSRKNSLTPTGFEAATACTRYHLKHHFPHFSSRIFDGKKC